MTDLRIYHNPRCSKSRGALALLEERGVDAEVVRYLDTPPDRSTLEAVLDALDEEPAALVRADDARKAGIDPAEHTTRDGVVDLLLEHPELMQRPVVVRAGRAVIGRPPEKVVDLLP